MNTRLGWTAFWLTLGLLILLGGGCATQKRCWEKWPPEVVIEHVQSDTTIYRDTIIYIKLPSDTVTVTDTLTIPAPDAATGLPDWSMYVIDTLSVETELASAYSWLTPTEYSLQRHLTIKDKDTTLLVQLDSAIRERDKYEALYKTEIHTAPPVYKCPWWIKLISVAIGFSVGFMVGTLRKSA